MMDNCGQKEKEMKKIGSWISRVFHLIEGHELPEKKEAIKEYLVRFEKNLEKNKELGKIHAEVRALCRKFPAYK